VRDPTIQRLNQIRLTSGIVIAGPSGRAVYGVGLRPLACCDRGFESHRKHGCLFECCVLSGRGLCDELITRPRGVLLAVARRCEHKSLT
jgi:hypothetical protein